MSKLTYQDVKTHPHPICFHRVYRIVSPSSSRTSQGDPESNQEHQAKMSKLAAFFKVYKVKSHSCFDMSRVLDKDSSPNAPENVISFMKKYLSTAGADTKKLSFTINSDPKNLTSILDIVQKACKLQELDLSFQSSSSSYETSSQQQQQITKFAQQIRKSFFRLQHLNLSFPAQDSEKLTTTNLSQQFFNLIAKRFSSISSSLSLASKNSSLLSHNFNSLRFARLGKELSKTSNPCKEIIFDFSFQGESLFESLQDFLRNIHPSHCNIQTLVINLSYCKEIKLSNLIIMFEMIREYMPSLKKLEVDMRYCEWATEENLASKIDHPPSGSKLANLTLNFWSNVNLSDSIIKEVMRSTILIQGSSLKKLSINLGKSSITSKTVMLLLFEVPSLMKYLREIVYNFSQCQKIIGSELENKQEESKYSKRLMRLKVQVMNCRGLQMKNLQALEEKLVQSFVNKGCLMNFNMKDLIKKKNVLPLEGCKNKEGNKK